MKLSPIIAVLAAALMTGCSHHGGQFVPGSSQVPPGAGNVIVNGPNATLPVPSTLPYATTLTMADASIVDGTNVVVSGGSSLPGNLPSYRFQWRSHPSAGRIAGALPGNGATLLEYLAIQSSQHLVGLDGLTVTANIPASHVTAGTHYWALLCMTNLDASSCQTWDGPFGPGTVTVSGSTATVSVVVPVVALPASSTHYIALYAIPDGSVPAPTPPTTDQTSFITNVNDPKTDPSPVKGLGIYFSVNDPTYASKTPFIPKGIAYSNGAVGQNGSTEPLDKSMTAVWTEDLKNLRAMGANAIRTYSVSTGAPATPPSSLDNSEFLSAAYQSTGSPQNVYTLLGSGMGAPGDTSKTCGGIPGDVTPSDPRDCYSKTTFANWVVYYQWLAQKFGNSPDVMGFVLGNETNNNYSKSSPYFWEQLAKYSKAIRKTIALQKGNYNLKLVVYSAEDDMGSNPAMEQGEQAYKTLNLGYPSFDVWGYDVYEGPTFNGCPTGGSCFFTLAKQYTTRPVTILEYGAPSSYHPTPVPQNTATPYPVALPLPHPTAAPGVYPSPYPCSITPVSYLPTMKDVVTLYSCEQQAIDSYAVTTGTNGQVDSGGFAIDFVDQLYKANGGACLYYYCPGIVGGAQQQGQLNTENKNGSLLFDDEAFFGLMSVNYSPPLYEPISTLASSADARVPRETYCWFQQHWTGQYAAPCQPQIRFVNGALNAGSVTWSVDGTPEGSAVAPASISAYAVLPPSAAAQPHTITFGSIQTPQCETSALWASSRTTVVLVGNGGSVPYACLIFDEPEVSNLAPTAIYHNAAAIYASTNPGPLYAWTSYANSASALANPSGLGFQSIAYGGPAEVFSSIPNAYYNNGGQYGSGTALEVNGTGNTGYPGSATTTLATFLPSSADSLDTGNYMPSRQGVMGSDNNYHSGADADASLFIIDKSSGGVSLIGTFVP